MGLVPLVKRTTRERIPLFSLTRRHISIEKEGEKIERKEKESSFEKVPRNRETDASTCLRWRDPTQGRDTACSLPLVTGTSSPQ